MGGLVRQAMRRSDAWVIGRRETVRVEADNVRVVATRGQRRLAVTLVLAIGVTLTGSVGAALCKACTMFACDSGTPAQRAKLDLGDLLHEAVPMWAIEHPRQRCPASIAELAPFRNSLSLNDPWGHPIHVICGTSLSSGRFAVWARSAGPDGEVDTDDDIVVTN